MAEFLIQSRCAPPVKYSCMFSCLSTCGPQYGKYICNTHGQWFNLTHLSNGYVTGENERFTRVNVYASGKNNLNIPLMINNENEVSQDAIGHFARNIQANNPDVRSVEALAQVISYYMGIDLTIDPTKQIINSWLNRDTSILYSESGNVCDLKHLPMFHQMIFHHTIPMSIYNEADGSFNFMLFTNLALELDEGSLDNYASFKTINKSMLLKYDKDVKNIVSTPLVMLAITTTKNDGRKTLYRSARQRFIN